MKYLALPRALASLRSRNFRLYWFGQAISMMGTRIQGIGQVWLVVELTHSGWQLGLLGALQALPVLLFSIFGGVFADRWPKRRVLLATNTAAALQALLLWVLIVTGAIRLWQLYVLAVLLGFTYCLYLPASRAFMIEMVGREDLPNAVALNSSIMNLARIVGPGLGGIIAASSVTVLFLLNALSFLPVIAGLILIRSSELHAQPRQDGGAGERQKTWAASLREGLSYIWQTPAVLLVIVVVGLVLLFGSNFNVVLPLFATDVLRVGATGFGFLSAAGGLGALLSTLWLAWANNQKSVIRQVLVYALLFALLEVAFAVSRLYLVSLVLITAVGFTEMVSAAQAMTALQIMTPDHLRGRVTSVQVLFFDGSLPLGYLLMGWLAGLYGAPSAMLIGAGLCLLVVGAGWLWYTKLKDVGEPDAVE